MTYARLCGLCLLVSLFYKSMQTLATINKLCKSGRLSTWYFVKTPTGDFLAIGGIDKESKCFPTEDEAHKCFRLYLDKYGYSKVETTLPPVQQLELNLAC